jgi:glycosyltransferase involved in cell wall biosynthesis
MTIVGIFLGDQVRTGGHVRYLELMEGLARRGNRVVVLMNSLLEYEPKSFEPFARELRYRRKSFPPASWVFAAASARWSASVKAAVGCRVDAVLVFGETHLSAGARMAGSCGAPLIYGQRSNTVREAMTYLEESGHGRLERALIRAEMLKSRIDELRILRHGDLLVFQSAYDRDDFLARNPSAADRCAVIRGDISGPRFKEEYSLANASSGLKTVCFMGTLGPRKGASYMVDAIVELKRRGFGSLMFRICGPGGDPDELAARIAAGGAADMAVMPGRVPEPFSEIVSADLLVVPSLFDSYPNTVLEALHAGTPVIGSRVGGIPDMLAYDELLFPPMDATAIADRIQACAEDPAFYARLRALCRERREAFKFDWAEAWEKAMAERLACASR